MDATVDPSPFNSVFLAWEVFRASDTWRANIFGSSGREVLGGGRGGDGRNEGEYFWVQWKGGAWRMEGRGGEGYCPRAFIPHNPFVLGLDK